MLRSIGRRLFGASAKKPRRDSRRRPPSRRLQFEGLEGRSLLSGLSVAGATTSVTESAISDGSFETPALAAKTYRYAATGSAWTFGAGAGIAGNRSGFTSSNPSAPDGTQVAFLQGKGTMTQSIYLEAGAYSISFLAAQRGACQSSYQKLYITVDGNRVAYVTPTSSSYGSYQTQNFYVSTSGMHTIVFKGLNPGGGDNTALVDDVSIESADNSIGDGSFEAPSVAAKSYKYGVDGSPWVFTGSAVSSNGSTFTVSNDDAPFGTQVGVLQGTGSISQSVYFEAGTYSVSFVAAQRAKHQASHQQIAVQVDGVQIDAITPSDSDYASYESLSFAISTSGMHTIAFVGLNPDGGDNTALIDGVEISEANPVSDGSFESPALTAATYQYRVTGSPWGFSGTAGISYNRSGFTSGNANAPDGYQVALLQGTGSMSQSVYLDAGGYAVSFAAAQRATCQTAYQEIEVLVDGEHLSTITPTGKSWASYLTAAFEVATGGMHTILFRGLNPEGGDNTALIDYVTVVTAGNSVVDGSFEAPTLNSGSYQYRPDTSAWTFTGGSGIASDSSAFTASNPDTIYGNQVAFLQNSGSVSESVYFEAGNYSISFLAAQRANYQDSYQRLAVLVDGVQVGVFTPSGAEYVACQTASFPVTSAGMHAVQFLGLNPDGGDNTAFIDNVTISEADAISDSSFETVALTTGSTKYQPTGSRWQYSGSAGVTGNSSAFTSGGSTAPAGTQVAFLQGTGTVSQSVYLETGTYTLSFQSAQRSGTAQTDYQQISVLIDGVQAALITPSSTKYAAYEVSNILISTVGMHTIQFAGLDPKGGDNTAFLDCVAIAAD